MEKQKVGCQPVEETCELTSGDPSVVLFQLSTSTKAKKCYCNGDGCNLNSDLFKTIVGGYLLLIIGILGIIGNALTFGVLASLKNKSDINLILRGEYYVIII